MAGPGRLPDDTDGRPLPPEEAPAATALPTSAAHRAAATAARGRRTTSMRTPPRAVVPGFDATAWISCTYRAGFTAFWAIWSPGAEAVGGAVCRAAPDRRHRRGRDRRRRCEPGRAGRGALPAPERREDRLAPGRRQRRSVRVRQGDRGHVVQEPVLRRGLPRRARRGAGAIGVPLRAAEGGPDDRSESGRLLRRDGRYGGPQGRPAAHPRPRAVRRPVAEAAHRLGACVRGRGD